MDFFFFSVTKLMVDRWNFFLNQRGEQDRKTTYRKKMAEHVLDKLPLIYMLSGKLEKYLCSQNKYNKIWI